MKSRLLCALFIGVIASVALSTSEAQGQLCQGHRFPSIQYGGGVIAPRPPYFAMHPPVYYDRVVPRAYGISPYAVPPGVMPVENTIVVQPKTVMNPFYKPEGKADRSKAEVKSASQKSPLKVIPAKSIKNKFYLLKVVQR